EAQADIQETHDALEQSRVGLGGSLPPGCARFSRLKKGQRELLATGGQQSTLCPFFPDGSSRRNPCYDPCEAAVRRVDYLSTYRAPVGAPDLSCPPSNPTSRPCAATSGRRRTSSAGRWTRPTSRLTSSRFSSSSGCPTFTTRRCSGPWRTPTETRRMPTFP